MIKTAMAIVLSVVCAVSHQVRGDELEVKTLNRSSAGFFVFSPDLVRIKPGDTINFVAADKGHEVHSVPGMIPDGAKPFDAKMSQDLKVTFMAPGIYVVACAPHTAMGMVGVVVVGDPINLGQIDSNALPSKAKAKLDALLEPLKRN